MDKKYGGMTVNESLYVSKNWNKYQAAVSMKDVKKIIEVLNDVELTEENIIPILESLGLKYEL